MANPWFRAYAEFASDPKVQIMSEAMQRRLHMLMCLRCSETLETLHETELAFALRISHTELDETKTVFLAKGFIDDNWKLINWDKRQFASDSSTERVRAHRDRKKKGTLFDETDEERSSNGVEQNRTDTEADQNTLALTPTGVPADKLLGTLPLNDGTEWEVCQSLIDELLPLYPAVDIIQEFRAMKGWLIGNPTNRKTKQGVKRFITSWLGKEQNKAKPNGGQNNGKIERSVGIAEKLVAEFENNAGSNQRELLPGR